MTTLHTPETMVAKESNPMAGRIATILTAIAGLLGALAVPIANLDWESTAGLLGGMTVILGVVTKWLTGWQADEKRRAEGKYGV